MTEQVNRRSSGRIIIDEDELVEPSPPTGAGEGIERALPPVLPRVDQMPTRSVNVSGGRIGKEPGGGTSVLDDPRFGHLIKAAIAIFIAWGVAELTAGIYESEIPDEDALRRETGIWTGTLAAVFGGVFLAFDLFRSGKFEAAFRRVAAAAIPLFISGFVSGVIAQIIFSDLLRDAFEGDFNESDFYLARAVAWGLFGCGVGASIGLVDRSGKKALNGAIGGLVGGAAGGLVFEFVVSSLSWGESISRLAGLLAVGLLLTAAIALVETTRRQAWLSIVGGGMTGKEFILYHALTRVGSAPECEVFLPKDPAVAAHHCEIVEEDSGRRLRADGGQVLVNGQPTVHRDLRSGDQIQIGGTLISYSERSASPSTS